MQTTTTEHGHGTARSRPRRGIVFALARLDLQHEWVLTLCLIMAVAAILSPLLLLFGLKYGTIETLRFRLVQDPRNRDIRPLTSRSFSKDWFAHLRQRPDVGFVVPTTRQISAIVTAAVKGRPEHAELDILPTAANDPVLVEHTIPIPAVGTCVLTHFAAETLKAQVGDTLVVTAKRLKGGQYEAGRVEMQVVGILSLRASALKAMYVPLEVLEAVERFKDGQAVPEFGWDGATPTAYPQYDGLVVVLPHRLSKIDEHQLRHNTGFTTITPLSSDELRAKTHYHTTAAMAIYFLATERKPVGSDSIETVRQRLRGQQAILLPWVAPITAQLLDASGTEIATLDLYALSVDASQAEVLQLTPRPSWGAAETGHKIMLPASISTSADHLTLKLVYDSEELTFPVSPVPERSDTVAFIPAQLGGILRLARSRTITYDADLGTFVLSRRGYAGFRLYARTIDDVDGLRQYFASQGIPVHTEAQRVKEVTDLDRYLTLIFWFVAAVGVLGGTTALIASLYATIERKKRQLGVLRLLGLSRLALFCYPIYQGMLIGLGGFAVAMAFFATIAMVINRLFAAHLQPGERFCWLPLTHVGGALGATVCLAIVAASWAAWRVTRIEPAEALRDE